MDNSSNSNQECINTEFSIGQIVVPISDPSTSGAIIQVRPGSPENRYVVFHGGKTITYYASQLREFQVVPTASREIYSLNAFHSYLTALQIRHPGLSNLYSLHAARIDYIPYQFKPVIKFIRSDRPRLLIADEVGVGKTIEAGLILRELQARRDINSVLIICPKPLVTERKWQEEMKRFDEYFEHLDGLRLRHCITETDRDGTWPEKYSKIILPFSLFNERVLNSLQGLDPNPHFDLVIVDEAHRLRNTNTDIHQAVRYFCDNADAVVFLTATPIQLGSTDLYVLFNILRPDLIIDRPSFEHMSAPNPYINRAIEFARRATHGWQNSAIQGFNSAADTAWGKNMLRNNPDFQKLLKHLQEKELSHSERISFIRETEQLHTFSSIVNRTRRRDIGNFTTRTPETVKVEFTSQQRELHDTILNIQAKVLECIHGNQNLKFMMTTIRRQLASCIYGLKPFLEDILTRRIDELQWDESDGLPESFSNENISPVADEIRRIIAIAEKIDPYDPKIKALLTIARDKQNLSNNKILLFSSFRHTLRYILEHLLRDRLRVALIQGDTPDEDRSILRERFSLPKDNPDALDILLSSEVGCEGLDYQFCDCIVNYDLPWNPMRIEQRIGRIDRYGQKSEKVLIYNLITPGTVDAEIYERCLWRIGVFHDAIGGCEEILGRITEEIHNVAENIQLTEDEMTVKLQQIADNEIRLLEEQADLEEKQVELFGLRLPMQQRDEEVENAASYWLSPTALHNLICQYLEKTCGGEQEYILGDKSLKTLRLNQTARNRLLEDYKRLNRKPSPIYREWEKWLKGNDPHIQITFNTSCASENRGTVLITPMHPLALQATYGIAEHHAIYTAMKVEDREVPSGTYPFAVYYWQKKGIREDVVFKAVSSEPALSERFISLLEKAEPLEPTQVILPGQDVFDKLDAFHHGLWSAARSEHQSYNLQLAEFRKESLRSSHRARINILHEQLNRASNDKIRRMKQSEISRAESDFERRISEILRREGQADIVAQAVAFGVVVVEQHHER